eukprot:3938159-Rhodomonas_salina.4
MQDPDGGRNCQAYVDTIMPLRVTGADTGKVSLRCQLNMRALCVRETESGAHKPRAVLRGS